MINQFICEFKITNFINEFGNKLPNCFCQFVNKFINSFYEFIYKFIKANFSLKYIHLLVSSCLFIIIPAYAQSTSFSGVQIGATQAPSTYSYSGGTYSLTASGSGIGGTSDSGYFVNTPTTGNIEITTQVANQFATNSNYAQAGLMIRGSIGNPPDTGSLNAYIYVTPKNGVNFSYRSIEGGTTTTTLGPTFNSPIYLKLAKNGSTVNGYVSSNGYSWTLVGSTALTLPTTFYTGFCANSATIASTIESDFNNFNLSINVPQSNSNMALWLRSDFGVTVNNSSVTNVQDQSQNAYNFSQSNLSIAPTIVSNAQNNLPAFNFNYANFQALLGPPMVTNFSSGVSIFMVASPNTVNSQGEYLFDMGNYLNNDIALGIPYNGTNTNYLNFHVFNGTTDNFIASPNSVALGSFQLFEATQATVNAKPQGNIFLNGSLSINAALNNPLNVIRNNNTLGGLPNGGQTGQYYFNGQIAEVLVYNTQLSQNDRQNIENYLLSKYNLSPAPNLNPPTITPATGVYYQAQTVTITSPINNPSNAPIYYTTDGSTPSINSPIYTGSFVANSSMIVQAAVITPYGQASTAKATYINIDPTTSGITTSNLALWLKADFGVTQNSNIVSGWQDLSPNNFNFYQANSSIAPNYVNSDGSLNNKPAINFNVNQLLTSSIGAPNNFGNGASIFVVTKPTNLTTADARILDLGNDLNNDIALGISFITSGYYPALHVYNSGTDNNILGSNNVIDNGAYLLEGLQTGKGTGYIYFNSNQSTSAPLNNPQAVLRSANAIGAAQTANPPPGQLYYTGEIAEIMVYASPLSVNQIAAIEAYLSNKYNIAGPALNPPTLSVTTGVYYQDQTVTITPNILGVNIYYTTDGSTPTTASPIYTGPITISSSTILQAKIIESFGSSPTSSAYIAIDPETENIPKTNLQLWSMANFGVTLSAGTNKVLGWQDLSGNNFNFNQSSQYPSYQPTFNNNVIGGQSALNFNGSQILEGPGTTTDYSSGVSVFIVSQPIGLSLADIRMLDFGNDDNNDIVLGLLYNSSTGVFNPAFHIYNGTANNYISTTNNITSGTSYLFEGTQNGASVGNIFISGSEQLQAALNNAQLVGRGSTGIGGIALGAGSPGTDNFNGNIAEVLVYNTVLGTTQRQAIESYLCHKYDIGPGPTLNPPTIAIANGVYTSEQSVTITQAGNPIGTNIYYTTDGTTPTQNSTQYTGSVTITGPTTLKAVTGQNYGVSQVATTFIDVDPNTANIQRSGLQGWYMANVGANKINANTVAGWYDLSGNNYNFNLGSPSYYPTINYNLFGNMPAVNFNSYQILGANGTSVNYANGVSVFVVAQPIGLPIVDMRMLNIGNDTADNIAAGLYYYAGNDYSSFQVFQGGNSDLIFGPTINSNGKHLFESIQTGASNTGFEFLDAAISGAQTMYPALSSITRYNNGIGGVYLGNTSSGGNNFNGNVAEVLVYNTVLGTSQRQAVEAYLANKYYLGSALTLQPPTIDFANGVYTSEQSVTITQTGNPIGTNIYYTTDGSQPTTSSTLYTEPISITQPTTLKAVSATNYGSSSTATTFIDVDPSTNGVPRTNLQTWLMANVGANKIGTNTVAGWYDLSGNDYNYNLGSSSYYPTINNNIFNNLPAVNFNGSQILGANPTSIDYSNGVSIFVVAQPIGLPINDMRMVNIGNDTTDNIASGIYYYNGSYYPSFQVFQGSTSGLLLGQPPIGSGGKYLFESIQTGASNTGYEFLNAALPGAQTLNAALASITRVNNGIGGVYLGNTSSGSDNFNGNIAEILVYNAQLTTTQRQAVEAYLSNKYGFTQGPPVNSPIITPANAVSPGPSITITISQVSPPVGNIYYTTDGTVPTINSNLYTGPFTVTQNTVIKAIVITSYGSSTTNPPTTNVFQIDPTTQLVTHNNLVLWLKSDYGVQYNLSNQVYGWLDMSGSNFTFLQSDNAIAPSYLVTAINNLPTISFNGSNQGLEAGSNSTDFSNGLTAFVVANPLSGTSSAANSYLFDFGQYNNNDIALNLANNVSNFYPQFYIYNNTSPQYITGSSPINYNQFGLFEATQNGISTGSVYVNALPQVTTSLNNANNVTRNSNSIGALLNGTSGGQNYFYGQIAEILVYNALLSTKDKANVEAYLMNRYQLPPQIPLTPVFSVPATIINPPNTPQANLNAPTQISIASSPNAVIHYTTDGTTATINSPIYTEPINVNTTTTISAVANNPIQVSSPATIQTSAVTTIQYNLDSVKFPAPSSNYTLPFVNLVKPVTTTP